MSSPILEIKDLNVSFGEHEVLKNLNFTVNKNDVLAIVGPNGAGKTVLFRALLGLIPYSGEIRWKPDTKIGYVPQKLYIDKEFPLSVEEFFQLKKTGYDEMLNSLSSVGIKWEDEHHLKHHILQKPIGTLSGGQLQRILIAWAISENSEVLLFDEPTSGIDVGGEETIYNLLSRLQREKHLTILLISHDLHIVYKYAHSVMCINKNMVCYGAPHEVLNPESLVQLYGGEASFYKHEHDQH